MEKPNLPGERWIKLWVVLGILGGLAIVGSALWLLVLAAQFILS